MTPDHLLGILSIAYGLAPRLQGLIVLTIRIWYSGAGMISAEAQWLTWNIIIFGQFLMH